VFIKHPPENSMASFNFISAVFEKGTTFIFGSWICVAHGFGGFNSHVVNSRKRETSASTRSSDLDEFIDNLDKLLLPDLALKFEKMFVFDATSTRDAPELVRSDSNQSEGTTQSKSLSNLEEDLDLLLKLKDVGATACRGGPFSITTRTPTKSTRRLVLHLQARAEEDSETRKPLPVEGPALENHSQPDGYPESFLGKHLCLTITSMPQGRFVYWKGFEPSELLDYESCLVAFTQELPFQEGKPLSSITEEGDSSTELLDYSHTANNSPDHQVYMASLRNADDDKMGPEYDDEQLADISTDEPTADAPRTRTRSTKGSDG
jgi:hypothetical protein